MGQRKDRRGAISRSWDPVADWYAGWVGSDGSDHQRRLALPAVIELLQPAKGEEVLDLGCGPGVLAPWVARTGARYTGIDASRRLLAYARRHHGGDGRFLHADATRLAQAPGLRAAGYDAIVFLLSIQDIEPLEAALASAAWALRPGGRAVLLMTHPCFRVPRQSGWGWDEGRRLQFRRVDRYLSRLAVPMKPYGAGRQGATRSYHRPLAAYINGLAAQGLLVDRILEIPGVEAHGDRQRTGASALAQQEIPLFLALRARKQERPEL